MLDKRCDLCGNDYAVECFEDDPVQEICNSCWHSTEGEGYTDGVNPPDLEIDVAEDASIDTGLA